MRLFVAVDPGRRVRAALTPWLDARSRLDGVRWTAPDNLHATLCFLGEQPSAALRDLRAALAGTAAAAAACDVRCGPPDAFPHRGRPRVLILPLHSDGALEALAARTAAALAPWRPDDGGAPFRAHLTLGRVRRGAPPGLPAALRALPDPSPPPFRAAAIQLVESVPGPGGARYAVLASFPLAEAGSRL